MTLKCLKVVWRLPKYLYSPCHSETHSEKLYMLSLPLLPTWWSLQVILSWRCKGDDSWSLDTHLPLNDPQVSCAFISIVQNSCPLMICFSSCLHLITPTLIDCWRMAEANVSFKSASVWRLESNQAIKWMIFLIDSNPILGCSQG